MEKCLAINGIIILFEGVMGGFWFASAIKRQTGREVAWRVVHSGGSMGGIMLMAFAAVWHMFDFKGYGKVLALGQIISAHLFMLAMIAAAVTGIRGLRSGTAFLEKAIYITYGIAALISVLSFIGIFLFLLS